MSQTEYRFCCRVLTASPPMGALGLAGSGGYRRKRIPFSPAPTRLHTCALLEHRAAPLGLGKGGAPWPSAR